MFSVLVIRLRSLRLLRVSGIVMRLRMFLLLITFLKASHSFRNRLLVICKNAYLFATRSEERFSRNAETDIVCRLLLEKKKKIKLFAFRMPFKRPTFLCSFNNGRLTLAIVPSSKH